MRLLSAKTAEKLDLKFTRYSKRLLLRFKIVYVNNLLIVLAFKMDPGPTISLSAIFIVYFCVGSISHVYTHVWRHRPIKTITEMYIEKYFHLKNIINESVDLYLKLHSILLFLK